MNNLTIIDDIFEKASSQFVTTLAQYKWDLIPESQLHAAKQALTKSDSIMKIASSSPVDVQNSLIQSAVLGLDLTEGKRQGWLLPRKNQSGKVVVCLQVGYKGVEAIHQRMGVIDRLVIRVVRENDEFEWSGDDQEKPNHKADWFAPESNRGEITGAYAITYFPDKSINVTTSSVFHIYEKHRDRSESFKSYTAKIEKGSYAFPPPWVSDEQSMIEKTMAYIAAKQWPANIRDSDRSSKILETLHETDIADYTYGFNDYQKESFYSLIEANDALGIYLFTRRVGIEVYSALTKLQKKSFPKGKKMAMAQKQNDFVETGHEIFINLTKSLSTEDAGLLAECVEDITEVTKKLVRWVLNDEQLKSFDELLETTK